MPQETRQCQNCKSQFVIEHDDFAFYEKMRVPPPTWCPDCRFQRRLLWRNERTLYKRTCDLCKRSIITIYNPRYPAPVYCNECWHSDKWDSYSFGAPYDPSRPFFEQFKNLIVKVPKAATHIGTATANVNSVYVNFAGGSKNCYLVFNATANEDTSYSRGALRCQNSLDMYFAEEAERCYEGINVNKGSKVLWGQNVLNSLDSCFLLNCVAVQNCFGCVNLRYKSFHFFNEPLQKDEWRKRVKEIMGSYRAMGETRKKFEEFSLKFPRRENSNVKSVGSTGDYIFESKNCASCFEIVGGEDCKFLFSARLLKDSYDVTGRGHNAELLYETVATGHGSSKVIGSWAVEASRDIAYSCDLRGCADCIGCVGLKHAESAIFNKRYSKEKYDMLREKIVAELTAKGFYGSYFPRELSPWAYNEAMTAEFFPLSKEEAVAKGFRWEDNIPRTKDKETLPPAKIPDHINDVTDSILNEMLKCTACGYNYHLVSSELAFYRAMQLPVPRMCFNCRHLDRIRRRGPARLCARVCAKCGKNIVTTYAPDRPEIVYCEKCYQAEVV